MIDKLDETSGVQGALRSRFVLERADQRFPATQCLDSCPAKGRIEMESEGLRVLLVDDKKSMQDILTITLQPAGYSVHAVGTGAEALQKFPLARPDLILLDLFLPDVDGKQILRRLREWTTSPIIVMSVRHEESEKIACLDTGTDDYLTKPFTMGELLARLRAALRRPFGAPRSDVFAGSDLKVDFSRREVFVANERSLSHCSSMSNSLTDRVARQATAA